MHRPFLSRLGSRSRSFSLRPHAKRSTRYLLIALLPLLLCWGLILNQSREWAMSFTEQNATSLLEKNCMLIEQRMDSLYKSLNSLLKDPLLNELIISSFGDTAPSRHIMSTEIQSLLSQHFWDFDSICALYIASPSYSDSFYDSTAMPCIIEQEHIAYHETLAKKPGTIFWFPTAHYSDIFLLNDRYKKYYSDYDVISLGVQMDLNYMKYGYPHHYDGEGIPPLILLNIFSSVFDQWLASNEITSYYIYTEDGDPIYSSGQPEHTEDLPVPTRADLDAQGQFRSFRRGGIKGTFICSQLLEKNGWIITSYTSVDNALQYLGTSISLITLLVICLTILLVLIVLHFTMRTISEPLSLLADGLARTADGHYEHRIQNTNYTDYQPAFEAYNNMNQNISKLITENYEIKLSEKELEIQLINLQFNPHFLYNMLNICSLMALEAEQTEISDMLAKLSFMMRYSVKTTTLIVPFREDLRYVEAYISAMQLRTNNGFTYKSDLDPSLRNPLVPKFLLQPFVENAIRHGFDQEQPAFTYRLLITARRQAEDLVFTVEDNGKGMDHEVYDSLWMKDSSGIGIANTHKRIQLYYGEHYGVQIHTVSMKGTVVTVRIPYRETVEA